VIVVQAGDLAAELARLEWRWTADDTRAQLAAGGWTPAEAVDGRETLEKAGRRLDVYTDGDRVERVETTLSATWPDGSTDYDDLVDEYFDKYEDTVDAVAAVLGAPRFNDGRAARGYPADQDAEWVALWPLRDARLMVQQTHEDKELPFRIVIVVAP
jgi:hypothetical protein